VREVREALREVIEILAGGLRCVCPPYPLYASRSQKRGASVETRAIAWKQIFALSIRRTIGPDFALHQLPRRFQREGYANENSGPGRDLDALSPAQFRRSRYQFSVPRAAVLRMSFEKVAEDCEIVVADEIGATVGVTVPAESAPVKRRGRPKGSKNRVSKIGKEAIADAAPWEFLIRVMEGRVFKRAPETHARRTAPVRPTLEQSITAAEVLLRKVAADLKATELSGPDGAPIESTTINVAASGPDARAVYREMGLLAARSVGK
jgi:hypothetical protein